MEDKLRRYIESLFEETQPTKKSVELREEMIQNLTDKYRDLINDGKTPEAAYNIAVAGLGDIGTLLRELEADQDVTANVAARRKSAMRTAIAVMMYILSVLPLIILQEFDVNQTIGIAILFVIAAAATGLLIYNSMTKPREIESETLVEEFREWQAETYDHRQLRRAISGALWSIITVLYFVISFVTFAWHVTWIIWILGAAIEALINLFFVHRKGG